MHFAHCIPDPL